MDKKSDVLLFDSRENILTEFAMNLKQKREMAGYSQENFSSLVGFSRSYYTEVENGKRNISLVNLHKIAKALDIEINSLITIKKGA